jgi:hypothetical protein
MKKIVSLLFVLLIAASLTACGGGNQPPAAPPAPAPAPTPAATPAAPATATAAPTEVEEEPEEAEDNITQGAGRAYEIFITANDALEAADSVEMLMIMDSIIEIEGEVIEMAMYTLLAMVLHSPTDISMHMESVMFVEGMEIHSESFFRDGVMYMQQAGEPGFQMSLPLEAALEMANTDMVSFPAHAVLYEYLVELPGGGYELSFLIYANAMTEMMDQMMGTLGAALGDLSGVSFEMDDVAMVALINPDGSIAATDMHMFLATEVEGLVMTMDSDITTEITQIGGVVIDFPDFIDDFVYLSF